PGLLSSWLLLLCRSKEGVTRRSRAAAGETDFDLGFGLALALPWPWLWLSLWLAWLVPSALGCYSSLPWIWNQRQRQAPAEPRSKSFRQPLRGLGESLFFACAKKSNQKKAQPEPLARLAPPVGNLRFSHRRG